MTVKRINVSEIASGPGNSFEPGAITLEEDMFHQGKWVLTISDGNDSEPVLGDGALIGSDGIAKIAPSMNDWGINKIIQIRAGEDNAHIHIDSPDNSTYDLILGDDSRYVSVDHNGYIKISDGSNLWYFRNGKFINPMNTAPLSSVGASGDLAGMVTYDQNYVYVCTQDWVGNNISMTTLASSGTVVWVSSSEYSGNLVSDFASNPSGWSYNGVTITNVTLDNQFGPGYYLEGVSGFNVVNGNIYNLSSPILPNIWKRVVLSNTAW